MKVLLTGAGGQLGQALIASAPAGIELVTTSRQQLDLADPEACRGALQPIDRPGNGQIWIIPDDGPFTGFVPEPSRLVLHLSNVTEGEKAVGEAFRDPKLAFVLCTQFGADPSAKRW